METEEKKKTGVFGDILYPKLPSSTVLDVRFLSVDEYGLDKYDPIIIATGTISNLVPRERKLEQVIAREREIDNALRKGAHVCILCHDPNDLKCSLETHKKNIIFEHHNWINDFKFDRERQLESEILELENKIKPERISLQRLQYLKSVLWLKHDELRDICMEVFGDMALKTLEHDTGQEDFWILNDANLRVCICEVKGKEKRLEMGDLIKFEANRDA